MTTKITKEIIEDYINCKTKAYLKLQGKRGVRTDYEVILSEMRMRLIQYFMIKYETKFTKDDILHDVQVTVSLLKKSVEFLRVQIIDSSLFLIIDGLKKVRGACKLGDYHYTPILCYEGEKIRLCQKQLVVILGIIIGNLQEKMPAFGFVYYGQECKLAKVHMTDTLQKKARRILLGVKELRHTEEPPKLVLNKHCIMCEFQKSCYKQAVEADDISLLKGMSEKEINKYNRKGIFTTTQLSCTFRLRKRGKRVKQLIRPHYFALQASAIRDQKIYILNPPQFPVCPVQIYFDIEGDQERNFVYLLGALAVENGQESWYSFWADRKEQELEICNQFLNLINKYDDYVLFHYGSYEISYLKRIRKAHNMRSVTAKLNKLIDCSCNVLSIIYSHIYFPLYSNGLKDVAKYLGYSWSNHKAHGLQSIYWRKRWEETGDITYKQKLEIYNQEDCLALRQVVSFIDKMCTIDNSNEIASIENSNRYIVEPAKQINPQTTRRELGTSFATADLEYINKCAYFDYQREKVFLRTNSSIKRIQHLKKKRKRKKKMRIHHTINIKSIKCPHCGSTALLRHYDIKHTRLAYDLKLSETGIRRQVIACTAVRHQCKECKKLFLPIRYKRSAKYFHSLQSWVMYQHIVNGISYQQLESMILECFGLPINYKEIYWFKHLLAKYYHYTYKKIIKKITIGKIVHSDETHINFQKGKGYVWVLTNMENVVFIYRPTREGIWFQELLHDYKGVLISDFYSAYNSVSCEQQKCLIHLIRDMNHDLLGNPYDEEFKWLVSKFGLMLRDIIASVDNYGLKKMHLQKHIKDVDRFFKILTNRSFTSELASDYQKRLIKNKNELFTFLRHDEVPWNNNNAEHAIKHFTHYRSKVDGKVTEGPFQDYLILFSIYQTCMYRGISFIRFLLSGEKDIDKFNDSTKPKSRGLSLQVYPDGCSNYYRGRTNET